MKTISSRAEECNSTTLARLADGLVRLRVNSPETQEVLQELAEVEFGFFCWFFFGSKWWIIWDEDEGVWGWCYHCFSIKALLRWVFVGIMKMKKARWYIMSQILARCTKSDGYAWLFFSESYVR